MNIQLPLGITLLDRATFANYLPGPNSETVNYLLNSIEDNKELHVYLWGAKSSGRSHLLQAACNHMFESGSMAAYIPLADQDVTPELLQNLDAYPLVCIDDIHLISGNIAWEEALFHFYNRIRAQGNKIIFSGSSAPDGLGLEIPDLKSRLAWGVVFQLKVLNDEEKFEAICMRIEDRGLSMSQEVTQYLMNHSTRDMSALVNLLNQLDQVSLQEQRKLTIPFIKQYMTEPKSKLENQA